MMALRLSEVYLLILFTTLLISEIFVLDLRPSFLFVDVSKLFSIFCLYFSARDFLFSGSVSPLM